ncbi:hypothetical protein [Streptococcus timonensis]|uniref:hypothetical protein n=1 Tax=Streptococcus timonensis TaxID=1852387 RepID=UPI00094F2A59|nr:hypothetical protein [Streptococcus timonensis]
MRESYSIELVNKGDDDDFLKALKIYDNVTPVTIKTDPNDFIYWVDNPIEEFRINIFKIYCNEKLIGMTMTSFLSRTKTMILEYIAVEKSYRKNVVYLSCLNLLGQYFSNEKNYSINYWATDINNDKNGQGTDSESKMFQIILDLEGYKKIDAPFKTPSLGMTDIPGFEAYIMIKSTDNIKSLSKTIYGGIIKSIFFDYYFQWYQKLLSKNDFSEYQNELRSTYKKLEKSIDTISDPIQILDEGYKVFKETTGPTPITKSNNLSYILNGIYVYLVTAVISLSLGVILSLITVHFAFNNITDKGEIIASIIAGTMAIPVIGSIFTNLNKKK